MLSAVVLAVIAAQRREILSAPLDSLPSDSHVTNAVGAMATSVPRKAQHLLSAHAQAYSGTGPDQPKGGLHLQLSQGWSVESLRRDACPR